jgi:hypothetical protein
MVLAGLIQVTQCSFCRELTGSNSCPNPAFIFFYEVDCYDRRSDDWTTCPSLNHERGNLAGVTSNGKIYAFGGGDGNQCFSDVEVFDPAHGKWTKNQPMLEKVIFSTLYIFSKLENLSSHGLQPLSDNSWK